MLRFGCRFPLQVRRLHRLLRGSSFTHVRGTAMRMRRGSLFLSAVLALVPGLALAQGDAKKPIDQRAAVKDLAKRIDIMIAKPWAEAGIKAAPLATDGELYR